MDRIVTEDASVIRLRDSGDPFPVSFGHWSDCALNDRPARRPKPCSCGKTAGWRRYIEWLRYWWGWRGA